jgi:hypothetical protein
VVIGELAQAGEVRSILGAQRGLRALLEEPVALLAPIVPDGGGIISRRLAQFALLVERRDATAVVIEIEPGWRIVGWCRHSHTSMNSVWTSFSFHLAAITVCATAIQERATTSAYDVLDTK